ncbi:stress responsive A/B barrel domain protein [Metarhizium album ARSEF 1941]|uniref:Stress responsive A/B barrel domain protein n=1 Tax=Metarhizium album (strain ARSEF 1941) TaxID=1081103 RepID=A0A0B2WKJ9_METAS|nr:stress responsive A/B barrel domain protein [Metarhizium album ARSEF 1941]KHN94007.1 stress responsive A/B barrel domain protein [Metarhizium album ARSEF 1941]
MVVNHVVMFQFKPDTDEQLVKQCCDEMLGLKNMCVLASTGKPYIANSKGGKDMSIEGFEVRGHPFPESCLLIGTAQPLTPEQNGFTHVFVVEFDSVADRDYYVKEDKAHHSFVGKWIKSPDSIVSKAMVVDFVPGTF